MAIADCMRPAPWQLCTARIGETNGTVQNSAWGIGSLTLLIGIVGSPPAQGILDRMKENA